MLDTEKLMDALFHDMPIPLWLFDFGGVIALRASGRILEKESMEHLFENVFLKDANGAALELYEASSVEELREKLPRIIPPESFADLLKADEALFSDMPRFETEVVNYTCKGKKLHVSLRFIPLASAGDDRCTVVSTVDLTRHKKLAEQNALLARLPEANPDIVALLDCEAKVRFINPAGKRMIRSLVAEGRTRGIFDILPRDFRERVCASCSRREGESERYSCRDREFLLKIMPFPNENRCMVTVSDITEIVRLKEEKELYFEAVQSVQQPIVLTDGDGAIVSVNRAFTAMYGYSEEEVKGRNPLVLNPGRDIYRNLGYSEKAYEALFGEMWKTLRAPERGVWEGTVINRTKEGRLLWINLAVSAIFNEKGEAVHFIALPIDITNTVSEQNISRISLYKALADLAEMRDNETGNHMRRVDLFAKLVADYLGWPRKLCDDIEIFAPMHDIGKVAIPYALLLAERKLSEEEFAVMKTHTLGHQILKDKEELEMAAEITLNHHDKFNGGGYPVGLSGDAIPLAARITALADVYDALRSRRPYKEPWTHPETVQEIRNGSGSHFAPSVVEAFLHLEEKFQLVYDELKDE